MCMKLKAKINKKKVKYIFKYILMFLLFLFIYEVAAFGNSYGDPIANYGFSHAIKNGQIPYLEFNIISTPLYAFLMSLGLHLWDNYLMFIIEQTILCTIMFYLLEKLYGNKVYLIIFSTAILFFYGLNPTYNFCCLFLLIVLLYLEKFHNEKDYLIGFVIGLSILAKQTIGIFFVLPTIIVYYRDIKKILKRAIGAIVPILIFVLYLVINKAFYPFINLCFFGLFDFASGNGHFFNAWFFIVATTFIITLIFTIKDKKNISNWYLLFGVSFTVPLFDLCHFAFYFFTLVIFYCRCLKEYKYLKYVSVLCLVLYTGLVGVTFIVTGNLVLAKKINHFEYTFSTKYNYKYDLDNMKVLDSYDKKVVLSYLTLRYDVSSDNKLSYFDVLLYGNFGYDGVNKMIKKIEKMDDVYVLIEIGAYNDTGEDSQFAKKICDYVIDNYKFIERRKDFLIYYKD